MRVKVPLSAAGSWREDVYNHKQTIALWLLVTLLDYGLTAVALSLGAHELNPVVANLSVPAFALYKIALATAAVAWLAFCKWLWCLKWLTLLFAIVVISNIYDLIVQVH